MEEQLPVGPQDEGGKGVAAVARHELARAGHPAARGAPPGVGGPEHRPGRKGDQTQRDGDHGRGEEVVEAIG